MSRRCEVDGCLNSTREDKPFCYDHLEEHPYVAGLLARMAQMDAEAEAVRVHGTAAARWDALLARELLVKLVSDRTGTATVDRLARETDLSPSVVAAFFVKLARRGFVVLSRTTRGSIVVTAVSDRGV